MTDKIILQLTLDELKTLDKHIEYNDETKSVFDKIKVAYPQPRMTLQQEGEYAVVSYQDKTYYRLGNKTTFSWWRQEKNRDMARPWVLIMISDAETERLLEGLYYNHIQVKKEKEQRTKKPVEECYKDWWGQYPETGTWDSFDEKRWQGFQAGYEFAYAISTAKEVMEKVQEEQEDNEWKSVALRFGEKLSDVGPDGYYNFTPEEWFDWVVNTYGKGQQIKNAARESVKWCEEHPDKDPLDWLKPQTPEQVADGLKEAFREAVKQGVVSSVEKPTDEEDNDKNFKNSLDLIKEWGEKNKPKTLYQICMEWWNEVFVNEMDDDICVDVLVSKIDKEFIPPSSKRNTYEWEKCLKIMRDKLR